MHFPVEVLFQAAKSAGMLTTAQLLRPSALPADFDVQWVQPDQLLLGDDAQSTDYTIEYESNAVPVRIERGMQIVVGGLTYRARSAAQAQGDGYFSRCPLERVRP